jgi:ABC-type Mn2+/Zn2+ transport system ATPase subunit
MADFSVVLDKVSVQYGTNAALRDVTASFPKGAVGLLGPNGAGQEHDAQVPPGFHHAQIRTT